MSWLAFLPTNCFILSGSGSATPPAGHTSVSCARSLYAMPVASWDGPPNPASQPCPSQIPPLTALFAGANTSAKAFAILPPVFIPVSAATANSL